MDINELRSQIDSIDDELVALFCQRMKVAEQIAEYKRQKKSAHSGSGPGAGKASGCLFQSRQRNGKLYPGSLFHSF